MAVTDVARLIIVGQFIILGLYYVVSEETKIFSFFGDTNVINICTNKGWEQYHVSEYGDIKYLTADVKQRVLFWVTKQGYFSMAVDGNNTAVNLSQKFKNGLVFQAISYLLEVQTGTIFKSGTDANIHVMIFGSRGNVGPLLLPTDYFDTDSFENGDINYINLKADDVGKVEGIRIIHDNSGHRPDWYVNTINISIPTHGMRYVFTLKQWIGIDKANAPIVKPSSSEAISYLLEVQTGTRYASGTDANIYLMIFGSLGNIGPLLLESYSDDSPFETGDINNINVTVLDIGKVDGIKIIHDYSGVRPDWYLNTINISIPTHGMRYVFTLEQWVDIDSVQMVKPSSTEEFLPYIVDTEVILAMGFSVYDGQIIFAAFDWGLMKFDIETNKRVFSLKDSDVKKYDPKYSIRHIDTYNNETCLYWHGPSYQQISRYLIKSNINQILVQRFSFNWKLWGVHQETMYWKDDSTYLVTTDMNLNTKRKTKWTFLEDDSLDIVGDVMYYRNKRNISTELMIDIYPLKPFWISCFETETTFFVVIPSSGKSTDRTVVESGVWSTIGLCLGIALASLILVIICFRIFKMLRNPVNSQPNDTTTANHVYHLPTTYATSECHIYACTVDPGDSKAPYVEVTD